jgi:proline iminopeptidase
MKNFKALLFLVAAVVVFGCTHDGGEVETPMATSTLENGSFTTDLNGFQIHYEVHGQGPVLMTLPNSWGLSLEGLRAMYQPLEAQVTMVYFDPRGMGESSPIREPSDMGMAAVRSDFNALRLHLGLDAVNVIGWSNGAMNLVFLAAEYPGDIETAIFLHGAASFTEEDMAVYMAEYPELMQTYMAFTEEMKNPELSDDEKTDRMRKLWLEEWFPLSFADPQAAPAAIGRLFADAEFSWAHAEFSNQEHPTFDARDQLPLITARSLVISGAHDMMPIAKGEELAEGLSNAEFVLFEESGHYAPVEEPETFETLIFNFLGV